MWWLDAPEASERERVFTNRELVRRILPLFRGHGRSLAMGALLLVGSMLGPVVGPILLSEYLIDRFIPAGDRSAIIRVGAAFFGVAVFSQLAAYFQTIVTGRMGLRILTTLKQRVFEHVLAMPSRFFHRFSPGMLLTRVESDTETLKQLCSTAALQLLHNLVLIAVMIGYLFTRDWRITLLFLIGAPILGGGTLLFVRFIRRYYQAVRERISRLAGHVSEYVQGVESIRHYGYAPRAEERLEGLASRRYDADLQAQMIQYGFWGSFHATRLLAVLIVLLFGIPRVIDGSLTLGFLVLVVTYTLKMYWPLAELSEFVNFVQRAFVSAERVFQILGFEPETHDDPEVARTPEFEHAIKFENVRFAYDADKPVIKGVDLELKRGERVALVGASGGGKSTIVNLLFRFHEPDEGRITADGVDIRAFRRADWRSQIGLVLQDVFLFPGRIRENLALGDDEIEDPDLRRAAEIVRADRFIDRMPDGFDAELAERGANLSQGERQLLSFARALAADRPILVLDEATSSVDPHTERLIQEAMERLLEGRTALIVAHRLSTIVNADRIVVVRDGEVVEEGRHAELYARGGYYRQLVDLQFRGEGVALDADGTPIAEAGAAAASPPVERVAAPERAASPDPRAEAADAASRPTEVLATPKFRPGSEFRRWLPWIWRQWRGDRPWILGLFLLTIVSTAAAVGDQWVLRRVVDATNAALTGGGSSDVLWTANVDLPWVQVQTSAGVLLLMLFVLTIVSGFYPGFRAMINLRIERRIRRRLFHRLLRKGESFFQRFRSGDLVTRLMDDIYEYPRTAWFCCSGFFRALESSSKFALCLWLMWQVDHELSMWVCATLPLSLVAFYFVSVRLGAAARAQRATVSETNDMFESCFSGIRILKAFGGEARQARRLAAFLKRRIEIEMRLIKEMQRITTIYQAIGVAGAAIAIGLGGLKVVDGEISVGTVVMFVGLIQMIGPPLLDIPNLFSTSRQAFVSMSRLEEIAHAGDDEEGAFPGGTHDVSPTGAISTRGLAFAYDGTQVLRGVDLDVRAGEKIAVVGRVGSGKSTLLRLMAGLLRAEPGAIRFGDRPMEDYEERAFRSAIGYVPQEPVLFSEAIRENVVFGRDDDDERLAASLATARIATEIAALPDGPDTKLGQRGSTMSGGQRLRLSIARALYGRPRILMMDDVTAGLDAENEESFWTDLERDNPGATCVVVTHRIATARRMDRVVVLDEGRVIDMGPHAELVQRCPLYRDFQIREELVKAVEQRGN